MPAKRRPTRMHVALAVSALLLAAPLLAHAYLGLFARYMADDYCTAASLRTNGLLGLQKHFYFGWSGRFAFTFTVGVVEMLGAGVVPYLPAVLLALWLAALAWAASQWRVVRTAWLAFALAELTVFATLDDNKSGVYEALYWQTGSLTYLLPLVLLTLLAGYLARLWRRGARVKWPGLLLCGALAFWAGGFSETSVVMQASALSVALAVCAWRRREVGAGTVWPAFAAALLGSLAALAVIALAPGNKARQAALPAPAGVGTAARASVESTFAFVFSEHNYQGTAYLRLVALLLPLLYALLLAREGEEAARTHAKASAIIPALVIPAAALVVIFACFLPSAYVMSREPPFRALVTPQFVLACALVSWGYALGLALRRVYRSPSVAVGVLSLVLAASALTAAPLREARKTLRQVGKARKLAALWDRQDAQIRAAAARGEERLTIPVTYNIGGTDLLTNDPAWYVNLCEATYYGVKEITATPGGEGEKIMFGEE